MCRQPAAIAAAMFVVAAWRLVGGADGPAQNLDDPKWWLSRARSEQLSIADPGDRELIGQIITSMEDSLAPGKLPLGDPPASAGEQGSAETRPTTFDDLAAAQMQAGQLDAALVSLSQKTEHSFGSAGNTGILAVKFAERDDWRGVERAMAIVRHDSSWVGCLPQLAETANRSNATARIAPLLTEGSLRVIRMESIQEQEDACQYLALAYAAVGDTKTAWHTLDQFGSDFDRAVVLVGMAQRQLNPRDAEEFAATMNRLTTVVSRDRLDVSRADPPEHKSTTWRRERQMFFSLLIGVLYVRAGDQAKAKAAIHSGFARAGDKPGTAWRLDSYLGLLPDGDSTHLIAPFSPRDVTGLLECVPTPSDRAMLAITGAMLAVNKRNSAKP